MVKINCTIFLGLSLTTGICFFPISANSLTFCQGSNCKISSQQLSAVKSDFFEPASVANNNRQPTRDKSVTGTVTYRQRIALPVGAVISIKLLDVSRQDAPAKIISQQTITTSGEQVPIPFKLTFDPAKIKVNHSYVVRGEIRIKNQLAFTTTKSYPVITNQRPLKVNLVLEQVDKQGAESKSILGEWLLEDLAGTGVIDNLQTTIKFTGDGQLAGSGGCNNYFAGYQIKGDKIKIGAIASTKKACPPAIMDQEARYFKALSQAYRFRLDKKKGFLLIDCKGFNKPLKFTRKN